MNQFLNAAGRRAALAVANLVMAVLNVPEDPSDG